MVWTQTCLKFALCDRPGESSSEMIVIDDWCFDNLRTRSGRRNVSHQQQLF